MYKALTIESASWNYYYPLTKRRCQKQPGHLNLKPSLAPNAIGWLSGRLFCPFWNQSVSQGAVTAKKGVVMPGRSHNP